MSLFFLPTDCKVPTVSYQQANTKNKLLSDFKQYTRKVCLKRGKSMMYAESGGSNA